MAKASFMKAAIPIREPRVARALAVIAVSVLAVIAVLVAIGILAGVDVPAMMEEVFTPAT